MVCTHQRVTLSEMDEQVRHPGPRLPEQAVRWLCGDASRTVVMHGVPRHIDPATFAAEGHDASTLTDEAPQVPHRSVDLLVVDALPDDLTALARMLRPGGQLALLHTTRDHRIPWARKLDRAVGATPDAEPADGLILSSLFGFVEEETFRHWQQVNRDSLSMLLAHELADDERRDAKTAAALELYADYGRGIDGMQLPWVTTCFRATVLESVWETPQLLRDPSAGGAVGGQREHSDLPGEPTVPIALADLDLDAQPPRSGPGSASDDLLLIDFR